MANDNNTNTQSDPYFDNLKAGTNISFDFVLWFYRILKYWYLFVIAFIICLGIAYLRNKSWVPTYTTSGVIVLEAQGANGVVNAIPRVEVLKNDKNQPILISSYGMTKRTVDSLPSRMFVDYFRQTHFKRINMYGISPVMFDINTVSPKAYHYTFQVNYIDNNSCLVSYTPKDEKEGESFSYTIPYDKEFSCDLFTVVAHKDGSYQEDFLEFNIVFLTKNHLTNMYQNRVLTEIKPSTSVLTLFIAGQDPHRDVDYLTSLISEFRNYNLAIKNTQAELTINFLNNQLRFISDSLQVSRQALDRFQKETGVYEISSSSLRKDLEKADDEKKKLALEEKALLLLSEKVSESIQDGSKIIEPKTLGITTGEMPLLVKKYNEIIEDAEFMGPKNPLFQTVIKDLNKLRANILKEIRTNLNNLQENKDLLINKYELLDLKIENLPPQEQDLIKFQREYKVNEIYHQFLTQKRYEVQIQKESNTPDNFVWEEPRVKSGPDNYGELKKNYTFWLFIGFIIPLAYVILKEEVLNYTISSKEECEKLSGLPVLGAIENISNKLKSGVVLVKNYPKSSFAESFRNIRVRLEYMTKRDNKFSVLVTSAEPGDGKTFIATNIASVYQMMHKKVVIIDLDLRRPSVAKTLKIENRNKGVSNYLIGQVELEEIIYTHPDYGFDVIPAGTLPPNPSELIKTEKTQDLLTHLQEVYDYVIVDCSPVGLVSDAYILAPLVDTTLFAVRRAKTNKSFFKSVITQLKHDGIANVALIFNDVKGREGYYGTSRYYGDKSYYIKKNSYYHDDYFEN